MPEPDAGAVRDRARSLDTMDDLDPLLERVGDARLVLLGEASHGTSEFYAWRARISERLVQEKGFDFIAVEGDWPACYAVNRYVKGRDEAVASAEDALSTFRRWPTWMWANTDVAELVRWLKGWNEGRPADAQAGFYGLDVYSLHESLAEIVRYLSETGQGEALDAARRAFSCFEPYAESDGAGYAEATAMRLVPESCEDEVVGLLSEIRGRMHAMDSEPEGPFNAEQNALVARNAERYYRAMIRGGGASWNARDEHMMETLDRLLDAHGPDAKGVVWAHNTHVGDARFTDMSDAGMTNLGELARNAHGEDDVVLVGFTTHHGSVIAGRAWDAPWEEMDVPQARPGTHEHVIHDALGGEDALFVWDGADAESGPFSEWRDHRAIGVVYHAERERWGNYVPTLLSRRYDAVLHVDATRALEPLVVRPDLSETPETYPSGL